MSIVFKCIFKISNIEVLGVLNPFFLKYEMQPCIIELHRCIFFRQNLEDNKQKVLWTALINYEFVIIWLEKEF